MATIRVSGARDDKPSRSDLSRGLPAGMIVVKDAVRVQGARAGAPPVSLTGVAPDDVVEIELQDGLRVWSRVADLERDFGVALSRGHNGDGDDETINLPTSLAMGGASRGAGEWVIKGLKVLGINIDQHIAEFIGEHVEGKLSPGPGLYRCSETDANALKPVTRLTGAGPVLVFLHGTASSTAGSFSGLWTGAAIPPIRRLFEHYQGRVLGFQHETLTKSPIENARDLVKRLSKVVVKGTEVHLVSHSRGGLIGELLARGMRTGEAAFTSDDLALFSDKNRTVDLEALKALTQALGSARLRISRFVRVACPARGTTLADGRLDRYFSVLVNLASLVPALANSVVYDGLTTLLAGVLKQRTDPRVLPGIEAMMPSAPLVRMLNRPDVTTTADLHVLGGDLAPEGVSGRLKALATDFYYRDDHDLVVNTPAMLGGIARTTPIHYWIDTGGEVTHFHYFTRSDTADRLVAALTTDKADFRTLDTPPSAVTSKDYQKRAAADQPVVFVLPGIMGSELTANGSLVWMDLTRLATGGLATLGMTTKKAVEATGLLHSGYAALCEFLAQTHAVVPFAYDWRQSIEHSASALREAIDARLAGSGVRRQPIRIVAHSMGGLVVRAMLATAAGRKTWNRAREDAGSRIVMLGTPSAGSHAIGALLLGRDTLVKKLSLLDITSDYKGLLRTIADFDGVLNLLPHAGSLDLYSGEAWDRLFDLDVPAARGIFGADAESSVSVGFAWTKPSAERLKQASRVRDLLRTTDLDVDRTTYIAGAARATACDIVLDEAAAPGHRVRVLATARGDGRVPWATGIPKGIRAYFADAAHGDLASTKEAFPAILNLLTHGTTSELPNVAPGPTRSIADTFELEERMPEMLPDREELVADALGGCRASAITVGGDRLQVAVRVVHDNLTTAQYPVLVGHYDQDAIVGAERVLDTMLSGRLSELHRVDLYPGPLKSVRLVLNSQEGEDRAFFPGAIVAGLGIVGELTPGGLEGTLEYALASYAEECVGRARRRAQREGRSLDKLGVVKVGVAAMLVGSGAGGLTLLDSIRGLLRAIARTNGRLGGRATGGEADLARRSSNVFIDTVDILELYEDRAIDAVYALRDLADTTEFRDFTRPTELTPGPHGRRRVRYDSARDWWQRIRVKEQEGKLEFEATTQLARARASLQPTQRQLVESFVDQAVGSTLTDPALGKTLFELLVPSDFKTYAQERRNLALLLDEKAAALPWELMHDGYDRGARPLSVDSGMIRQLLLSDQRERVTKAPVATALVIGNPKLSDPRFPDLQGALKEACEVYDILEGASTPKYTVEKLTGADATPVAVMTKLHERQWRILHLAGHGVFEWAAAEGQPSVTGFVLDNGIFFTPAEAEQMRFVPELVFINCCHLGNAAGDAQATKFHRLAANLATQFIRMGARAVVAAGWAVDDHAARAFASRFYREMLRGRAFGEAVAEARREIFTPRGPNTWGAYQCYGDPSFSFSQGPVRVAGNWVSQSEVVLEIESVAAYVESLTVSQIDSARRDFEALLSSVPARWLDCAEVQHATARAFLAFGDFERAIAHFERVAAAERANAPISAMEQLANARVRLAWKLNNEGDPPAECLKLLDRSERLLKVLLKEFGATVERSSLLGSLNKRRAMMTTGRVREAALIQMARAYRDGTKIARGETEVDLYPLVNHLSAQVMLAWTGRGSATAKKAAARELETQLAEFTARADASFPRGAQFFDFAIAGDARLLTALASRKLSDRARKDIRVQYAAAGQRGVSPKHRASFFDQLAFFTVMTELLPASEGRPIKSQMETLAMELSTSF